MGFVIKYGLVSIQSLCISYEAFMVNVFLTSYLFFESFSILDSPKYFLPFWSSQYTSDLFEFELRYHLVVKESRNLLSSTTNFPFPGTAEFKPVHIGTSKGIACANF